MALQASGAISLYDISNEFGGYAYPPVELDDYMAADPVNQPSYTLGPNVELDFSDFYGTSIKTTRLSVRPSTGNANRYGYSKTNGYFYYMPESGQSGTAFGSSTRTSSLASGSRTLSCVVMDDMYFDYVTIGFYGGQSSAQGGWTSVTFYDHQSSPPYRPDLTSGITLYRADRQAFGALPNTSPTVYGYRFGYNGANTSAVANANAVSTLIKTNAVSTPYYVYVEFT
jgi:hypothetical protein